ncbi:hypothetical protein Lalb_Chr12g0206121 [Lupinus albus]|uniref:Uncharacterized protein n=1 Tax=Lupinus albus TaxID=3870 RepID=A0A6A4PNF5_LUPAL|nr:hypothetical protein Lalb_Chr12g0206121 [Lupinus albus]
MPKVKRFQNPFKSAPQSQRVASPIEDPTHYSPAINPTDHSLSVQAPSKATLDTSPPVHSSQAPNVSALEVPEEVETFTNHVGRESTHYWIVEATGK